MKGFNIVFKVTMWALILISVALVVVGFATGWPAIENGKPVEPGYSDFLPNVSRLLGWAYVVVGITLIAVVVIGLVIGVVNDPKSIVKLLIIVLGIAVVCYIVYRIAPGSAAQGNFEKAPDADTLKLTDTVLYLTYFTGIVTVCSIIVGEIRLFIANRKG